MKRFPVTLALAAILFALSSAAVAQQRPDTSRSAIQKAIADYAKQTEAASVEEGFPTKAVSRTDKAESVVIGTVSLVGGTDFLDDGTPFRIVAVRSQRPISQNVFVVCIGSSLNNSCGRLTSGKRASFTSDVIVIDEGDEAGLALLFVKKLQT